MVEQLSRRSVNEWMCKGVEQFDDALHIRVFKSACSTPCRGRMLSIGETFYLLRAFVGVVGRRSDKGLGPVDNRGPLASEA